MTDMHRRKAALLAAMAFVAGAPSPALAQAWLAPKGEASLSFAGQYLDARYHLFWQGQREDRGRMQWSHLISDLSYSVSDRFAVRVGIPFVVSRYTGPFPHVPVGRKPQDDGTWNPTFQDLTIEARYQAATGALAVTPFVALSTPVANYEILAHTAAGKGLREATAGVYVGRRLDPILPQAYAQAKASFSMPERVIGVWHNRNNASLELGYFVLPAVSARVVGAWQWTHGGFRIPIDAPAGSSNHPYHDQLAKDMHFLVAGGISYAATGSVDISATGLGMISGRNSNLVRGVNVGVTWSFSPARLLGRGKSAAPPVLPGLP